MLEVSGGHCLTIIRHAAVSSCSFSARNWSKHTLYLLRAYFARTRCYAMLSQKYFLLVDTHAVSFAYRVVVLEP